MGLQPNKYYPAKEEPALKTSVDRTLWLWFLKQHPMKIFKSQNQQ